MARKRTTDKQHRWLSQVEVTGVVFSEPVLAEAAPSGFPNLDKKVLARFHKAREIWNLPKGMLKDDGQAAWVRFVLEEILRLRSPKDWLVGSAIPAELVVRLPAQQETLRPDRVLVDDGAPVLLLLEVPRTQSLDRPWVQPTGRWKASPTTKLERLLRETKVELGLVTNGEAWRLVVASPSETASWLTWTASSWAESSVTLAAFRDLLGEERFFAGAQEDVALELIRRSRERQLDVADQLGEQARQALALLVHELDRVDAECGGAYLDAYTEREVFEAIVAFIMRLLFLLFAEENALLPHGTVAYDRSYGVLHLLTDLEGRHRLSPEKLKHSYSAFARLLATSRLVHDGSVDADIRVAAHGGPLFDPSRHPLLEGRRSDGSFTWEPSSPPRVRDSVVREVLRSLKYARSGGSVQLVSYRGLAVEQIGHMYEGLLDRRVARAPRSEGLLLFRGTSECPFPPPLPESAMLDKGVPELLKLLAKHTGRSKKSLEVALDRANRDGLRRETPTEIARVFLAPHGHVRASGLFVTAGEDRRSQGAHYTPPSLTEPITRRVLEPQVFHQPDRLDSVRPPSDLLSLRICDPAMGSGAFLVQAVRYLAERLVDSWELEAAKNPVEVLTMPLARPSTGDPDDAILPDSREERLAWAKRHIAERCIYGVDANPHAVEMAKLSLWIATAAKGEPFTFLDHALKHGDSLVGVRLDQIQRFHWTTPDRDWGPLFQSISRSVDESRESRDLLRKASAREFDARAHLLEDAETSIDHARAVGDAIIASFFAGTNPRAREQARQRNRGRLENLLDSGLPPSAIRDSMVDSAGPETFHWEIEFPEVFARPNGGFDAMLGNPPFLGGRRLSSLQGPTYMAWLQEVHHKSKGGADLVAHFFRRSYSLLRERGTIGLIATNTIGQGDTRATGLRWIRKNGGVIYNAIRRLVWPGDAAVVVSVVHIAKNRKMSRVLLDDREVQKITAFLFHAGGDAEPRRLQRNAGQSFQGAIVLGMGFTFDDLSKKAEVNSLAEMRALLASDHHNQERIFPYIGGQELNSSPQLSHHRYVIDFGEMSEQEARRWPDLFKVLERKVKPGRAKKDAKKYPRMVHEWWKFWNSRPELREACAGLRRVLAVARVGNHAAFAFLPARMVYSEQLIVFPVESFSAFCALQSRVHEIWARFFGSSMKDDLRYTPRDCFETFPFPDAWKADPVMERAGREYYELRGTLMREFDEGLTAIYNRFHSPTETDARVVRLRQLHDAMDAAMLAALGWTDLSPVGEFYLDYAIDESTWSPRKRKPYRCRWSDEVHDEVLARLLDRNNRLHAMDKP